MKKIYQLSGAPARPPTRRTPADEEAFQLSKELMAEILGGSRSQFWRKKEKAGECTSPDDFDEAAIVVAMKEKYALLSDEQIVQEVRRRIYLHYLL